MKKGLISIGLLCILTPVMSDNLAGILVSQDTENVTIDGREFEGDGIVSFVFGRKNLFSDSFGAYLSAGGTFGATEEERKKDEQNKDFKNTVSHRVFNLGLTYSPISNITLLGGAGYGQYEGKYYNVEYDKYNRVKFNTSHTDKEKGVNYNVGLNLSYGIFGVIAMYDSYPKVFSVGLSYNYGAVVDAKNQREETTIYQVPVDNYTPNPNYSDAFNEAKRNSKIMRTLDSSPTEGVGDIFGELTVEEATCNEEMRMIYFGISACQMLQGNVPYAPKDSCTKLEKARKAASLYYDKEITSIPEIKRPKNISIGSGTDGIKKIFDELIRKPSFCK